MVTDEKNIRQKYLNLQCQTKKQKKMKISEKYADYILEETKKLLEIDSPSGYTKNVAEYVMEEYHKLGYKADMTVKGGVLVDLGGEDESNAVMLDTHIDTLGGMVSEIKADGNLRIVPIGGLNANNTEAENVRVVTRDGKIYTGVFQLDNASVHVNKEYSEASHVWKCFWMRWFLQRRRPESLALMWAILYASTQERL